MPRWMYVALGALVVFAIAGICIWTAAAISARQDENRRYTVCSDHFDREDLIAECMDRLE